MKLHGALGSSGTLRVRIALNLKGIGYEAASSPVDPGGLTLPANSIPREQRGEIGSPPSLPYLEDRGDLVLQSLAIVDYLDEIHPFPPFLPAHPVERARVRAIAQMLAVDLHPLISPRACSYLTAGGGGETSVRRWTAHWLEQGFGTVEEFLDSSPHTGRFCHGNAPTLSDICLVPEMLLAQARGFDLAPYPTMRRIHEACIELEAFARALAERRAPEVPSLQDA